MRLLVLALVLVLAGCHRRRWPELPVTVPVAPIPASDLQLDGPFHDYDMGRFEIRPVVLGASVGTDVVIVEGEWGWIEEIRSR